MAFEKLQFTKSWESDQDFPTYEPSEAQVRADLQLLHDEARDGLNRLVDALNDPTAAAQLPFQGQGLAAENLQDAILEVYGAVQTAAAAQIVNGSVTREKLEEELLARTYGGRAWVSMDTPGPDQTPETDFPIGQVWLRPSFTVENLAGSAWSVSGGTVEALDQGWKLTGSGAVVSAVMTQSLTDLGAAEARVFVSLRASQLDSQLTGLTLTLNGTGFDLSQGGGVFETVLDSQGGLTVTVTAQWPAAALAVGSVTVTHFAVVNADETEAQLTDCEALSDWPALLTDLVPFASVMLPQAVYIQVTPGSWHQTSFETLPVARGGTGLDAVSDGALLHGTGGNSMAAIPAPEEDSLLRYVDGKPAWGSEAQVVSALGVLRCETGTYTGNGEDRTITLPVTPKLLVIWPKSGPLKPTTGSALTDNPIVLGNGAKAGELYTGSITGGTTTYLNTVALDGEVLTFISDASSSITNAATKYGNRSGVTYVWFAIY